MHAIAETGHAQPLFAPFAFPSLEFGFSRDDDRVTIEGRLAHRLDKLFRHFHRHAARRAEAVGKALESASPLVDQALAITAGTFRLSIQTIAADAQGNVSVNSLVIEASLFRLEATTPEGSLVLDFAGVSLSLDQTTLASDGSVSQNGLSADFGALSLFAGNQESFLIAQQAVATLTETRLALAAYRDGGPPPPPESPLAEV